MTNTPDFAIIGICSDAALVDSQARIVRSGTWELRNRKHVQTFSSIVCRAAVDRLAKIAEHIGLDGRMAYWQGVGLKA